VVRIGNSYEPYGEKYHFCLQHCFKQHQTNVNNILHPQRKKKHQQSKTTQGKGRRRTTTAQEVEEEEEP